MKMSSLKIIFAENLASQNKGHHLTLRGRATMGKVCITAGNTSEIRKWRQIKLGHEWLDIVVGGVLPQNSWGGGMGLRWAESMLYNLPHSQTPGKTI